MNKVFLVIRSHVAIWKQNALFNVSELTSRSPYYMYGISTELTDCNDDNIQMGCCLSVAHFVDMCLLVY